MMATDNLLLRMPLENPHYRDEWGYRSALCDSYEHHARIVRELNALAGKAGLHGDYLTADSLMDAVDRHNAKCKALRHELDDLEADW